VFSGVGGHISVFHTSSPRTPQCAVELEISGAGERGYGVGDVAEHQQQHDHEAQDFAQGIKSKAGAPQDCFRKWTHVSHLAPAPNRFEVHLPQYVSNITRLSMHIVNTPGIPNRFTTIYTTTTHRIPNRFTTCTDVHAHVTDVHVHVHVHVHVQVHVMCMCMCMSCNIIALRAHASTHAQSPHKNAQSPQQDLQQFLPPGRRSMPLRRSAAGPCSR
jgi:hypothetical protein